MNQEFFFGQNSLRFWFYRYKDSPYYALSIFVITIVVCLFLFFEIVVPKTKDWFSINQEIKSTQERISVLKSNINFMSNLDRGKLNSDLQIAIASLPPQKDFEAIINAISVSALKSGVSLADYTFEVGSISSSSAKTQVISQDGLSNVKLTVVASGNVDQTRLFLAEIQQKLPLAEVTSIDGDRASSTINIQFYVKAFPEVVFKDEEPLTPVSANNNTVLQQMAGWNAASAGFQHRIVSRSSSSAMPLF